MKCQDCGNWLLVKKTIYSGGPEIINWSAPEGRGHCKVLDVDTAPEFGCLSFIAGEHLEITLKDGEPWQHSHWGKCPECNGSGATTYSGCGRCVGTGRVLYYDDGYIGEERYRMHPKEKELRERKNEPKEPEPSINLRKNENSVSGAL